jgi:hypothetical protein
MVHSLLFNVMVRTIQSDVPAAIRGSAQIAALSTVLAGGKGAVSPMSGIWLALPMLHFW